MNFIIKFFKAIWRFFFPIYTVERFAIYEDLNKYFNDLIITTEDIIECASIDYLKLTNKSILKRRKRSEKAFNNGVATEKDIWVTEQKLSKLALKSSLVPLKEASKEVATVETSETKPIATTPKDTAPAQKERVIITAQLLKKEQA